MKEPTRPRRAAKVLFLAAVATLATLTIPMTAIQPVSAQAEGVCDEVLEPEPAGTCYIIAYCLEDLQANCGTTPCPFYGAGIVEDCCGDGGTLDFICELLPQCLPGGTDPSCDNNCSEVEILTSPACCVQRLGPPFGAICTLITNCVSSPGSCAGPNCPPLCPPPLCNPVPSGCIPTCPPTCIPPIPGCPPACPPPIPSCPVLNIPVPTMVTTADADGDGVPIIILGMQTYQLNPNCSLTPFGPPTSTPVPFPDPDDTDVCNPMPLAPSCGIIPPIPLACQLVSGQTMEIPSGVTTHDPEGDGWPDIGVQYTKYTINADCTLTQVPGATIWCTCPTPPVMAPGAILCGNQSVPCIILLQTAPGVCGVALDEDRDQVPIVYTCDTTYKCWSDGHCDEAHGAINGSYGDPDDHDPCVPINLQQIEPDCHPNTTKGNATAGKTNTFDKDGDLNLFNANWWGKLDFPWWIILVIIAILWYMHKTSKERARRRGLKQGRSARR